MLVHCSRGSPAQRERFEGVVVSAGGQEISGERSVGWLSTCRRDRLAVAGKVNSLRSGTDKRSVW